MPLIDQRILIAAPAEAVWVFLVDPTLMVKWNRGCKQLVVLSTRTTGVGVRRRVTDERGRSVVEEITHWLDNLGYEYVMIDGPYRSYRGRIRLQAVPEGTIINWSIEYRLRGLLAGLRNLFSYRHRVESQMADSLRQLRRMVEGSGARVDPERQARFAMRAAPSAEARAALVREATPVERVGTGKSAPMVRSDDNLPDPSAAAPTLVHILTERERSAQPAASAAPSFAAKAEPAPRTTDVDPSLADTKPRKPRGLAEVAASQGVEKGSEQDDAREKREEEWDPAAPTIPVALIAPPPESSPSAGDDDAVTQTMEIFPPTAPETLPEQVPTPRSIILPEMHDQEAAPAGEMLPLPTDKQDTGEISIWDVFGIVPPSERTKTDLEAIIASLQAPPGQEQAQRDLPRALRRRAKPNVRLRHAYPARGKARLRQCSSVLVRCK